MNWQRSAVVSYLQFLWQYRFTSGGKWMMAGLLLSGLLGSASVQTPIYQVFCILLAFFCIDRIAGFLLRPKLGVHGTFPDKTTVGQVVVGRYTLVNQGKLTAYDLGLRFFRLPASVESS